MKRILPLLFIAFSIAASAQKAPAKFGDIPMEDMTMKVYPLDSSANAVVLFDYGVAYLSATVSSVNLFFENHVRIKILKKEGLEKANISVHLYHNNRSDEEKLSNLKAVTYNLENEKIVETPLSKENVFKEKFNQNYNQVKFSLPNVKEGSIIEYSYKLTSDFVANFPNWRFQRTIPVRHSEYWAMIPDFFFFEKYMQGYVRLAAHTTEKKKFYGEDVVADYYLAKNVPAFKEEAYMTSEDDYVSKINFALSHYQFPGGPVNEVMGSWQKLNETLLESEYFGKNISGASYLKDNVQKITDGKTEPLQKIEAISNYIRKNFEWDGDKDYETLGLKKVMEKKKGSSGDLNILLASMLNKAGLDVNMVLLSTRDHGFIRQSFPMRRQFNYVICSVKVGDKELLLDATEKYLPYDVLPSRCLNGQGLRISKTNFGWIDITSKAKNKTYVSVDFVLNDAGELKGKVSYSKDGYDAQEMRDEYFSKGEEAFAKDFLSGKQWTVEKSEFKDMDDLSKVAKGSFEVSIDEHAVSTGNVIYINPFVVTRIESNPFKSETREYPVDFGSKIEKVYGCKIVIPEGYQVDELPKIKALALQENAAKYLYNISQIGNTINITSNFQINKNLFLQAEYAHLREFYNVVIAKQAEQIVLKKK
ncbi:MAG: DUF3857 domain-containing protein [Bacteroidetes bacterium]|nr:DUF3857 domain-containing protein [Bacteroidota bacterium]